MTTKYTLSTSNQSRGKLCTLGFNETTVPFNELHTITSTLNYSPSMYRDTFLIPEIKNENGEVTQKYQYGGKGHRANKNITSTGNLFIFDIDENYTIEQVQEILKDHTYLIVTTQSHKPEHNRFRLIMPLEGDTSVFTVKNYKVVLPATLKHLGFDPALFDSSCFDISRNFAPNRKKQYHEYNKGEKSPLLIEDLMKLPPVPKAPKVPKAPTNDWKQGITSNGTSGTPQTNVPPLSNSTTTAKKSYRKQLTEATTPQLMEQVIHEAGWSIDGDRVITGEGEPDTFTIGSNGWLKRWSDDTACDCVGVLVDHKGYNLTEAENIVGRMAGIDRPIKTKPATAIIQQPSEVDKDLKQPSEVANDTIEAQLIKGLKTKGIYLHPQALFEEAEPLIKITALSLEIAKRGLIKIKAGEFYTYSEGYWQAIDQPKILDTFVKMYQTFYNKSSAFIYEKSSFMNEPEKALLRHVKKLVPATSNQGEFVSLNNGTLTITADKVGLIPHDRDHNLSYKLEANYNIETKGYKWHKFLNETLPNDDQRVLQEIAGYCLSTNLSLHKWFILFGSGANGKSVFTNALNHLLRSHGDNVVANLPLNSISASPENRVGLVGKLANIVSEISGNNFESSTINQLTSHEEISVRKLYGNMTSTRLTTKHIFSANNLPKSRDSSNGLLRRAMIVAFNKTIPEEQRNPQLNEELEDERDYLLLWAVEGLRRLLVNKAFTISESSRVAQQQFKDDLNPITQFMAEAEIKPCDSQNFLPLASTYKTFVQWNAEAGGKPVSRKDFRNALISQGIKYTPSRTMHGFGFYATWNSLNTSEEQPLKTRPYFAR